MRASEARVRSKRQRTSDGQNVGPILGAPPLRPTACARIDGVRHDVFRKVFDEVEAIDGLRNKVSPHFP